MTATTQAGVLLRHLRTFAAENGGGPSDRQLLERFAARREQAAFAALVRRHAALVLGVCRRVLRQEQDAEDAFQATFLVLAKKAREVGQQGSLAGWLHRVAYHAALRARARAASRQEHERQAPPRQPADPLAEVTGRELLGVLDEELQRLPEDRRAPLVLCYLQGHTCDGAARQLGWSVRTLKRRLEQGRQCLRGRLARRGVALPAALLALGVTRQAEAALPQALLGATVRAALDIANGAGTLATSAGTLAETVLRGLSPPRLKIVAALLVLGAVVFGTGMLAPQVRPAPAQGPDVAAPAAAPPMPAQPAAPPAKDAEDAGKAAITGRVLDADGKPVKGAAVTGYGGLEFGSLSVQYKAKALGEVKTDADGRFRLPLALAAGERFAQVEVLAGAKGFGPAWSRAAPDGGAEVELRLPPEEAVVGRLIDLQGQPVGKAKLRPRRVLGVAPPRGPKLPGPKEGDEAASEMRHRLALMRRSQSFEFWNDSPIKGCSLWPQAVTTDADGRFRVNGFGRGQQVDLVIEDDRVAAQEVIGTAGDKERDFTLVPPHKVTGRVVAADTEKPVAGASVRVTSFHDRLGYGVDARTDADGRFAANAYPGESYGVEVYPQQGDPYLAAFRQADWPRGAVKQEVNLKLPRGAVVRAKVVEAGTDKAVVSATVVFYPQRDNNVQLPQGTLTGPNVEFFTGPDGTVQMVLPPRPGHLVVIGPNPDYTYSVTGEGELPTGKPGGRRRHFHAILPLDLRTKDEVKEVKVELRRAVTIKGRVVGPDDTPIKDAVVFAPAELLPSQSLGLTLGFGLPAYSGLVGVSARDGAFELRNCDPDKTYRVYVLTGRAEGAYLRPGGVGLVGIVNRLIMAKDPMGAVADVSAKKAGGKPVEIQLGRCESAEVRFVDGQGKAVRQQVWLDLLVKPGADGVLLASPYSLHGEKSPVEPDADGRITIPGLIPGATYRLKVLAGQKGLEDEMIFAKEFTVEAGKTTKLELEAPKAK
jgi:RNA polymerase sigma factor (sigma-70 family)